MVLSNCVLHERSTIVHMRIDDLTTSPFLLREWLLVYVEDLEPGPHEMMLLKCLVQVWNSVTNNILHSNMRVIN